VRDQRFRERHSSEQLRERRHRVHVDAEKKPGPAAPSKGRTRRPTGKDS
jgi:hypothetical protein